MNRYLLGFIILLFAFSLWGIIHTLEVNAPEQKPNPTVDVPAAPLTTPAQ
jgi:hypothetical protein